MCIYLHFFSSSRPPDKCAYLKIILFLNQNICCGYSKEPSRWEGSFEHPKHMFRLLGKNIFAILRSKILRNWTYVKVSLCDYRMSIHHLSSIYQQFLRTSSPPKPPCRISPNFTGIILRRSPLKVAKIFPFHEEIWLAWQPRGKTLKNLGWPSTKIFKKRIDPLKNMAAKGQNQLFLCIYRENIQKSSCQKLLG